MAAIVSLIACSGQHLTVFKISHCDPPNQTEKCLLLEQIYVIKNGFICCPRAAVTISVDNNTCIVPYTYIVMLCHTHIWYPYMIDT